MSKQSKQQKQSKVTITLGDDVKEEVIDVRTFPENVTPATVSVGVGKNIPLRQKFAMAKPTVHVSIPCYQERVDEALEDAYQKAQGFLDELERRILEKDRK